MRRARRSPRVRPVDEEGAHELLLGASQHSGQHSRDPGLTYNTLVAPGGVEPPLADSKSAALSTELRGPAPFCRNPRSEGEPRRNGAPPATRS